MFSLRAAEVALKRCAWPQLQQELGDLTQATSPGKPTRGCLVPALLPGASLLTRSRMTVLLRNVCPTFCSCCVVPAYRTVTFTHYICRAKYFMQLLCTHILCIGCLSSCTSSPLQKEWFGHVLPKKAVILSPHSGMARDSNAVDAVVALSIARLRGLSAQHHGSNEDASAHLEEGMRAGCQALAGDNQPGIQWLMRNLVMNLKLAQADTYCCMVRPSSQLL